MCGIIGYFGRFDQDALGRGLDRIAHRGPDDSGTYFDDGGAVGLGHRRLSILDLSPLGHQPMSSDDGAVTIIFNGEIFNFREIRLQLESQGVVFRGHSDTEVLLSLYLAEGEQMLGRLNGMFAFAIWDRRSRMMFIARDGMGIKPLYYCSNARGVAFASEIKGLLRLVPEERELDLASLHRYLTHLWCPGAGTPLKSIRKLLPGHAMTIREGTILRLWEWYTLPHLRGVSADLSEAESIEGTAREIRAAVTRQLVSDVPVGAFLSGGLDSSAVVAFARETASDFRCFTIESQNGVDEGETDDLPYARRVAEHLGVRLDIVTIDSHRMAGDIEKMIVQLDEPLADAAPLNVLYICQLAREQGIKVLLSGAGGDDLFTGYRRHVAANYERWWSWLPEVVRRGFENWSAGLDKRRPTSRRVARLGRAAGLSGDQRIASYFAWVSDRSLRALYSDSFRSGLGDSSASAPLLDTLRRAPSSMHRVDKMLSLEQLHFLPDHNLPYTDRMSMAVGVEVRVPLIDKEVVEFAARIPIALKQRGRVGKWVFKKAMEPYLPHETIYRPKSGFTAPIRRWMRSDFKPMLADVLSPESVRRRGLFDVRAVERLISQNDSGNADASHTLLSLLSIEIWCRNYIDRLP